MTAPTPPSVPTAASTSTLEWVRNALKGMARPPTAADFFEGFLRDLRTIGVAQLEANRNVYKDMKETALTSALLAPLTALYDVTTETNSNGHPDMHLSGWPGIKFKGEAKILKKPDWYLGGLEKLVAKYNSGNEENTLMIGFCRAPDMYVHRKVHFEELNREATAHFMGWEQGPDHKEPISKHLSSGNPIRVHHVWANCHYETDAALKKRLRARPGAKPKRPKKRPKKRK